MAKTVYELMAEGHNIDEHGGPARAREGCVPCNAPAGCDHLGPHLKGRPVSEAEYWASFGIRAA